MRNPITLLQNSDFVILKVAFICKRSEKRVAAENFVNK